jgi:hypothetical protein
MPGDFSKSCMSVLFNKILRGLKCASELYHPSDRCLSAMLMPIFMDRGIPCGQHNGSLRPYSRLSRPEPQFSLPSSSSIVLTRLSGLRSRPTNSQKTDSAGNRTRARQYIKLKLIRCRWTVHASVAAGTRYEETKIRKDIPVSYSITFGFTGEGQRLKCWETVTVV